MRELQVQRNVCCTTGHNYNPARSSTESVKEDFHWTAKMTSCDVSCPKIQWLPPKSRVTWLEEFSRRLHRFLEEVLSFGRTMELKKTQLLRTHQSVFSPGFQGSSVTYLATCYSPFFFFFLNFHFLILKTRTVKHNLRYIVLKGDNICQVYSTVLGA